MRRPARRRPRTSRTCRSPSPTATTRRCSRPRRRSPPRAGAKVTVFDAANDPKKQLAAAPDGDRGEAVRRDHRPADLRAAAAPDGQAGDQGGDQGREHRPDPRHEPGHGSAAGARHVRATSSSSRRRSARSRASSLVAACAKLKASPCTVGYLYSVKVSSLDTAIRKGFNAATAGHNIKVVAEGETFYKPANALKAAQTMLQAQPDINVIMGADQGATGAQQALNGKKNVTLIGYGGGGVGLARGEVGRLVRHGRCSGRRPRAAGDAVRAQGGQAPARAAAASTSSRACRTAASSRRRTPPSSRLSGRGSTVPAPTTRVVRTSSSWTSPSTSAASRRSAASRSTSPAAPSTPSSARTEPASRRSAASSPARSRRDGGRLRLRRRAGLLPLAARGARAQGGGDRAGAVGRPAADRRRERLSRRRAAHRRGRCAAGSSTPPTTSSPPARASSSPATRRPAGSAPPSSRRSRSCARSRATRS